MSIGTSTSGEYITRVAADHAEIAAVVLPKTKTTKSFGKVRLVERICDPFDAPQFDVEQLNIPVSCDEHWVQFLHNGQA